LVQKLHINYPKNKKYRRKKISAGN